MHHHKIISKLLEDPLSKQNINVVIMNWLSNLNKIPHLIKTLHLGTLQTRYPWPVVWCPFLLIKRTHWHLHGTKALVRFHFCDASNDARQKTLRTPMRTQPPYRLPDASYYGYSIAPCIKQGLSEEGVPWSSCVAGESGILFIFGVLTRSSYCPFGASRARAANVQAFFLSSIFLSHSLTHALTRIAHTPQLALHALTPWGASLTPMRISSLLILVWSNQRSSYGTEILRFDQSKGCLTHIADGR